MCEKDISATYFPEVLAQLNKKLVEQGHVSGSGLCILAVLLIFNVDE